MNLELATPVGKRRAWRVSTRSGGAVTYLREKATLRQELGDVGREDDVPAGREEGEGARGQSRNFSVRVPGGPCGWVQKAIRVRARKPRYRRVAIDPGRNFGCQTLDNTLKDVTVASVRREPLNARDAGAGAQRG